MRMSRNAGWGRTERRRRETLSRVRNRRYLTQLDDRAERSRIGDLGNSTRVKLSTLHTVLATSSTQLVLRAASFGTRRHLDGAMGPFGFQRGVTVASRDQSGLPA